MANVKISDLTAATALATTDQLEINNAGTSKSVTGQVVADFAASSTNTLTNKTFDTAGTGNVLKINGTAVSDKTGGGKVVLDTSPTLVTPALGTPSAIVLTNATSVPVNQATGTLGVSNGGTGQTSYTDGQLLIGNSSGNTLTKATLTAGNGVTITNGNGSISIAAAGNGWMFGDGADGDVTVTGSTTLTRDMYYNNLTLNSSAAITTAGYRIFVAGTLDISAAPAGSIKWNAVNTASALASANLGGSERGGAVRAGTTSTGAIGQAGAPGTSSSATAVSGAGGAADGGTAGGAGASTAAATAFFGINLDNEIGTYRSALATPAVQVAGSGGSSAGAGGGVGGVNGGNGGRGGAGGGTVVVVANIIARGTNSTAGIIQALGAVGADGTNGAGSTAGGGGGGTGGGGGRVIVVYGNRTGLTITGAIDVSGSAGGKGGNGAGTGNGGGGGGSGGSGTVYVWQAGSAPVITTPVAGSAGSAASGSTGGNGATTNTKQVNL